MFALVDCNNFYCSCEKLFDPGLRGKPIVVLSNNDGCVVARSDEAKAIGIVMGTPEFMVRQLIQKHDVKIFSSNYTLYGDMSDRVMRLLASFVPRIELYSIDEAFLDMHSLVHIDLFELGKKIRRTIFQYTGIPVTVGIAATKTLAKMANSYAKKKKLTSGVCFLKNQQMAEEILAEIPVKDVWGIGHQYANLLTRRGYKNALALLSIPEDWIREQMAVVGLRMIKELKGIPAHTVDEQVHRKKNICVSRAFGVLTTEKEFIAEALANHTATCAASLRKQDSAAKTMTVMIQTNPHRTQDRQYAPTVTFEMEVATNNTADLIRYALKGLDIIFQPDHSYMKCGLVVADLVPAQSIQFGLFANPNTTKNKRMMSAVDRVNQSLGREVVRFAVQGFEKKYRLRTDYLSKKYTTDIRQVLHVKI